MQYALANEVNVKHFFNMSILQIGWKMFLNALDHGSSVAPPP